MKSIVVVIQQPSAELPHFEQRSFSKAVQRNQSQAKYSLREHLLFSLKLFALLVCFWQSCLSNINCSLQEVMVDCMFQSCEMISLVSLLYVSVHSNSIVMSVLFLLSGTSQVLRWHLIMVDRLIYMVPMTGTLYTAGCLLYIRYALAQSKQVQIFWWNCPLNFWLHELLISQHMGTFRSCDYKWINLDLYMFHLCQYDCCA